MKTKRFDVIVAGGGTAGVIAGIAAARNGAKTLIVEKQRCLGGQFTAGMMGAWVGFMIKKVIVKGIAWELRNLPMERNAIVEEDPNTDVCFLYDTEAAKIVLDEMVSKVRICQYVNTSIVDVIKRGYSCRIGYPIRNGAYGSQSKCGNHCVLCCCSKQELLLKSDKERHSADDSCWKDGG